MNALQKINSLKVVRPREFVPPFEATSDEAKEALDAMKAAYDRAEARKAALLNGILIGVAVLAALAILVGGFWFAITTELPWLYIGIGLVVVIAALGLIFALVRFRTMRKVSPWVAIALAGGYAGWELVIKAALASYTASTGVVRLIGGIVGVVLALIVGLAIAGLVARGRAFRLRIVNMALMAEVAASAASSDLLREELEKEKDKHARYVSKVAEERKKLKAAAPAAPSPKSRSRKATPPAEDLSSAAA